MSKILILTMHKVGSSSMLRGLKAEGHEVDKGYAENITELPPLAYYDAIYTTVRDPIARNVSYLFEMHGNRLLQESMRLERIKEVFFTGVDQLYPLTWFDKVYYPIVGLDVYKYDFPENGILILGKALIMRMEQMKFEHRAETETTRPYGALYHEFEKWVKFPKWYLDDMYESEFTKHFFTPKEIEKLYARWIE